MNHPFFFDGGVKSPIYGVVAFFQMLGIPSCIASPMKKLNALYPKALSTEKFGKRSVCRNTLIASLLLRCGYIEKMDVGIRAGDQTKPEIGIRCSRSG